MIKDMVDRMAEGETLEISYQPSPSTVATMYVKMDRNRCNVLYRKKRSDDWGLIVLHPDMCAALMRTDSGYSIVNEYTHSTQKALNAVYAENATIASEDGKGSDNPKAYTYHFDPDCACPLTAEDKPTQITEDEYLGKWKIWYPKEEKE